MIFFGCWSSRRTPILAERISGGSAARVAPLTFPSQFAQNVARDNELSVARAPLAPVGATRQHARLGRAVWKAQPMPLAGDAVSVVSRIAGAPVVAVPPVVTAGGKGFAIDPVTPRRNCANATKRRTRPCGISSGCCAIGLFFICSTYRSSASKRARSWGAFGFACIANGLRG